LARQRELAATKRADLTAEQLQDLKEKLKANQEDLRSRLSEIRENFKNKGDVSEIIDAAKDKSGGGKPRRGQD